MRHFWQDVTILGFRHTELTLHGVLGTGTHSASATTLLVKPWAVKSDQLTTDSEYV
jgi:hypothetical protein